MVVLPLFWDQVDNAQRVDETGFGVRLPAYGFEATELTRAIDRLLADRPRRRDLLIEHLHLIQDHYGQLSAAHLAALAAAA